jgi:hypothetical protein
MYNINVNGEFFEDVAIVGVEKVNYWWLIYVAVVLILLWLWFVWFKSKKRLNRRIRRTIQKGKVVRPNKKVIHSNKKHGEFGGAPMSRVKSEGDHVKRFKEYMGRAVSFKDKKRIKGLGRKKDRGNVYGLFGKKKKVEDDVSTNDVFSGVNSGWSRNTVEKVEKYGDSEKKKDDKKDEPQSSWFNMFD